ncbi:hypothetical protein DFJ73DRAFT_800490 [Zopfochytrium polystomum]|nr:hypothetical protein DFJ73DRAFT_800490 [Zopfochytrium polystomum]
MDSNVAAGGGTAGAAAAAAATPALRSRAALSKLGKDKKAVKLCWDLLKALMSSASGCSDVLTAWKLATSCILLDGSVLASSDYELYSGVCSRVSPSSLVKSLVCAAIDIVHTGMCPGSARGFEELLDTKTGWTFASLFPTVNRSR